MWFLDRNLDDCMHTVKGGEVTRALRTCKGPVLFSAGGEGDDVLVKILEGPGEAGSEVAAFVSEWFDLGRPIKPFYTLLRKDPDLAPLARRYRGFKIVGIPDLFECLVWCIAGQQIHLNFAYTLKRRLVERWGEKIRHAGVDHFLFPRPEVLASLSTEALREMQFTTRKAEYIVGIARAFAENRLSKEILRERSLVAGNQGGEQAMLAFLLSFRGVGQWSANYALMKSMGAMDRIPLGDAGVNQALLKHKGLLRGTDEAVKKVFEPFSGWKTYLVFYLWRSLREMA